MYCFPLWFLHRQKPKSGNKTKQVQDFSPHQKLYKTIMKLSKKGFIHAGLKRTEHPSPASPEMPGNRSSPINTSSSGNSSTNKNHETSSGASKASKLDETSKSRRSDPERHKRIKLIRWLKQEELTAKKREEKEDGKSDHPINLCTTIVGCTSKRQIYKSDDAVTQCSHNGKLRYSRADE